MEAAGGAPVRWGTATALFAAVLLLSALATGLSARGLAIDTVEPSGEERHRTGGLRQGI